MQRVKVLIPIFLLILTLPSCRHGAKSGVMPPLRVETAQARSAEIYNRIEVASSVESLYEVVIQPRVEGFLNSINYSDGMPVKRGWLLFTIDPTSYNIACLSAQASLESARSQEVLARSNLERAEPLARIDAISQSDLDQYAATYKASIAAVKSAREALNNANLNLSYTKIYAPIDGLVASSPATVGDYVGASTQLSVLTTISYIDTVEVALPIPTSLYMQSVKESKGGSFDNSKLLSDITLTLSGGEEYNYQGEYNYTKKDSPSASSTVVIYVKFANPELRLKSGMFARVGANIGEAQERVVVPQIAVNQTQGVNSVWVVSKDSVASERRVTLGATHGKDWIITEGLSVGERVLLTGQLKVHNGMKIAPQQR